MNDGYHFSDCPSRSGAPDCDCRYRGEEIEKALEDARKVTKQLYSALESIEYDEHNLCPICGNFQDDGHKDYCKTKLALNAATLFINEEAKRGKDA